MKRRQIVAVFHLPDNLIGKEHALGELLGTVNHTMSYRSDFGIRADTPQLRIGEDVKHSLHSAAVVNEAKLLDRLGAVCQLVFQKTVGQTDFLHSTFGEHRLVGGIDKFVFNGTAAAVEHKNIHR